MWRKKLLSQEKPPIDAKSYLQEWCLSKKKKIPVYKILEKSGPDHKPTFLVELRIENFQRVKGEGSTKKNAEIDAAQKMGARRPLRCQAAVSRQPWRRGVQPSTRSENGAPSRTRAAQLRQRPRRHSDDGSKPARSTAVSSGSFSGTRS